MAKGGARARSGPAPDPEALRRDRADDAAGWVVLPAAGRQGKTPAWPLAAPMGDVTLTDEEGKETTERALLVEVETRELEVWAGEWRRPQAVEWERNGQELEVALYVRSLVSAEDPAAKANARTLVKQQQEALGISLPGLHRNRWRIAEMPQESSGARAPVRSGLKVVRGGAE